MKNRSAKHDSLFLSGELRGRIRIEWMRGLIKEERMDKAEKKKILEKVQKKKALVGEMEKVKIDKANWVAVIVAGVLAAVFMVIEGLLGHITGVYALGAVCYAWAAAFYFSQYFLAKRPWQVFMGAVLEALGAIAMITLFILRVTGVMA